jgi:hypothetical protein
MAAESLCRDKSHLGQYYRRLRARIGPAQAVTAAAHKLARIVYHMITTREAYDTSVFAQIEQRHAQRLHKWLNKQAQQLGYALTPIPPVSEGVS